MQSHELRTRFLQFFERQQHTVRDSDALVPAGDPTVLFTSAGMNQFKDYFLGKRTDLKRAASSQKCMRAGDLERVGRSASHHTFFEMLGNFSFGDYFKREAIQWAWEFLTGTLDVAGTRPSPNRDVCLALLGSKLWVSVYEEDDEAAQLWRELGMPAERIVRFGQADNFWPANAPTEGPNGPCGPCSEIYFDRDGQVNGPRSVEIWNLVFTQFNRLDGGKLEPLPRRNIDTGMGLERLTRVVQAVETDYETDLFRPIIEAIGRLPHSPKASKDDALYAQRAIADHVRAITFLIAEGIRPSNESRGYVLRMLIRRAYRLGLTLLGMDAKATDKRKTGIELREEQTFLCTLVDSVIEAMRSSPYQDFLTSRRERVIRAIAEEEEQFVQTLEQGTNRLDEVIEKLRAAKQTTIAGEDAFKLYDTYGFPLELTVDIAKEHGLTVDRERFAKALKVQQDRSRAGSQFGQGIFVPSALRLPGYTKAEFVGYDRIESDATVKGIWKGDQWVSSAAEGDEVAIVLDRSPFYGEAGGQVGDQGMIETPKGLARVGDTKWADDLLIHQARIERGQVAVNEPVRARVDEVRRRKVASSHTATHLLHWALRSVLGPETAQAGSLVEAERIRFDFSASGGLHDEQRMKVEQLVNDKVRAGDAVHTDVMLIDEAKRSGAVALFGEKYGQHVRVVTIGGYSKELCGGTHVSQTGPVGTLRIVAESSVAAGTRRLEALIGESALDRQQHDSLLLTQAAQRLSRPAQDILTGIDEMLQQLSSSEKQIRSLKQELARFQAKQLVAEAKRIDGILFVSAQVDGADRDLLAALADAVRSSLTSGVALLASAQPSSVAWVLAVTGDLVKRGWHAGQLLKPIAAVTQGGGGGRPEFAQAGGKDPSRLGEALVRAEQVIREAASREAGSGTSKGEGTQTR